MLSNFTVRISSELKQQLIEKVRSSGYKNVSAYIRMVVYESLQKEQPKYKEPSIPEDFEYLL
jgi:Arc/MetJ-type ribon-helix-helix transcriptional regulator